MKILLHLGTKLTESGTKNPKDYPFVEELKALLKDHELCELTGPIPLQQSKDCISWADRIICIDSFLQHLCWYQGKQAIVLWGQSDPLIFGHPENINLLKGRKYLRERQYWLWSQTPCNDDAFVKPYIIIKELNML